MPIDLAERFGGSSVLHFWPKTHVQERNLRFFRLGISGLLATTLIFTATLSWGQTRVQIPTSPPATTPGNNYWPSTPAPYSAPPAAPPNSGFPNYPAPAQPGAVAPPNYTPPAAFPNQPTAPPTGWDPYAEPALPGAAQPYSPYAPSPYAANPNSLPAFGSQPYTTPQPGAAYSTQPGALYPDGLPSVFPENGFFETFQQPMKFFQEARLRYTWISGNGGSNALGLNELETSASFAVPIIYDQAPLIVTPGFGLHLLDGPTTPPADLPAQVYDAFLDTSWRPQFTPWLGANIGVRVGVYSDFETFNTDSIRLPSRALGVITLTPNVQMLLGVVYLDRVKIKILPAGGIIWTPNADTRWEILFPNPKFTSRLTTLAHSELWWYVSGEYGGGSWTMTHIDGDSDQFDYNDIRVMLGIETVGGRTRSFFEAGYLFDRELVYRNGPPKQLDLTDAFMLRAGFAF